jgi:hypothetical protein
LIIVQTPLRISFFGGGTDFPSFFMEEGGCVLSSAIDKYIFVTVKKRFDRKLRIGYTQTEMVDEVSQIHHEMIREALLLTGVSHGIEVTTMGRYSFRRFRAWLVEHGHGWRLARFAYLFEQQCHHGTTGARSL